MKATQRIQRTVAPSLWAHPVWILVTRTATVENLLFGALVALGCGLAFADLGPVAAPWAANKPYRRGFSIPVHQLPITSTEHVAAHRYWRKAPREYMRDYTHWATMGALCELLPQPGNRATLADETDGHGLRVAHFSCNQCERQTTHLRRRRRGERSAESRRRRDDNHQAIRPPRRRRAHGVPATGRRDRPRAPRLRSGLTLRRGWQPHAHAGCRQSGAHDHGAGRAHRRHYGSSLCSNMVPNHIVAQGFPSSRQLRELKENWR
jgi:hypothetical protein